MRKFLMAAAVLGVAACGEKTDGGVVEDTTTPAAVVAPVVDTTPMTDSTGAMGDSAHAMPDSAH